ncbi:hypothetical protein ElyMa_005285100 [Elysia marginata]|uniref:Uncharacterized protein n=1 Tax=Elysia marginata TaxID=1093978 RepID=A0AAV4K1Z3_9GAST|nr:hypothetical protein ElyMa_005285100 [Elysia marginata]
MRSWSSTKAWGLLFLHKTLQPVDDDLHRLTFELEVTASAMQGPVSYSLPNALTLHGQPDARSRNRPDCIEFAAVRLNQREASSSSLISFFSSSLPS